VVSFKSADTPAMPGILRKSTAFVPRYQKFESISLQRRVIYKLDHPAISAAGGVLHKVREVVFDLLRSFGMTTIFGNPGDRGAHLGLRRKWAG
jgi:hypothetical protein